MEPAKKLGFGLMRLPLTDPNNNQSIDIEQTKKMVDVFLERGFTYFDTAWMYCGFQSEKAVKEALTSRHPRDSFTLATKLHAGFVKSKEDRDMIFNTQLEKTGAGYFDYYLIHDIEVPHYETFNKFDCFNWIKEKKDRGLVKKMGFSFHDSAEFLDKVLTEHPEFDFVQLQINYLDWDSERVQSGKCYETAVKHGKKVVVMEPIKGGKLANVPENVEKMFKKINPDASPASWAIRFAASLENVFMVLSGMSNMKQMLDNTDYMTDFKPLTKEEMNTLKLAVKMMENNIEIPCTGCAYCKDGCPAGIPIPDYFSLYNSFKQNENKEEFLKGYEKLSSLHADAKDCIGCGQCESICPQHLDIIENLKKISGIS